MVHFCLQKVIVKSICLVWQVCDAPLWTLSQWRTPQIFCCEERWFRIHLSV